MIATYESLGHPLSPTVQRPTENRGRGFWRTPLSGCTALGGVHSCDRASRGGTKRADESSGSGGVAATGTSRLPPSAGLNCLARLGSADSYCAGPRSIGGALRRAGSGRLAAV